LENDQSITFISSKFIKSNSVESLQGLNDQRTYVCATQRDHKPTTLIQDQASSEQSHGLFTSSVATIKPYKRRNKSSLSRPAEPSYVGSSSLEAQSNANLTSSRSRDRGLPPMTEIVSKEDLQRLQRAITMMNPETFKQTPVLYINELRRLAKVINRVFDH
jgi:hypothetical protein